MRFWQTNNQAQKADRMARIVLYADRRPSAVPKNEKPSIADPVVDLCEGKT